MLGILESACVVAIVVGLILQAIRSQVHVDSWTTIAASVASISGIFVIFLPEFLVWKDLAQICAFAWPMSIGIDHCLYRLGTRDIVICDSSTEDAEDQ